jgi:hypothetical protein
VLTVAFVEVVDWSIFLVDRVKVVVDCAKVVDVVLHSPNSPS